MNDILDNLEDVDDYNIDNYQLSLKVNKVDTENRNLTRNDKSDGRNKKRRKILDKNYSEDNTNDRFQKEELTIKKNIDLKRDNFIENNISTKEIINNALFTQLSEIKVNLLNLESQDIYESRKKLLPKIDYINLLY